MCLQIIGKEIPGEGISIIKYYDNEVAISGSGEEFPIPAVAVTNRYVKRKLNVSIKKKHIIIRDSSECQYCGKSLGPKQCTIDHVIPRSRGGKHTWDNVVLSCKRCNTRKDDNTPEEAGMKLRKTPKSPNPRSFYKGISPWRDVPEEWKEYLD